MNLRNNCTMRVENVIHYAQRTSRLIYRHRRGSALDGAQLIESRNKVARNAALVVPFAQVRLANLDLIRTGGSHEQSVAYVC